MNYLDVANSNFMFLLCAIPVMIILVQTILFIRLAWKQGVEIGMSPEKLKQCIRTSATFSVIPTLTLVALLVALSITIGKYFPWLRLSNIGAGAYEAVAAEIGFSATHAAEWSALTLSGFLTVMLCMNLGMSVAPLNVLLTLKSYDKKLRTAKKTNPFIMIGTGAAFVGVVARLSLPFFVNYKNHLSFIAAITGALVMYLCHHLGKTRSAFKDFGFSFAIITGIVVCIAVAALGIV